MRALPYAVPLAILLGGLIHSGIQAQTPYSGHGAGSVSREKIVQYAPPPLDPEVTRRIQMMLDVRSPALGRVTPDGQRLVFGWSITGTPAVWRLDGPKSFPVQMTGGEDPTGVVGVTPDGRWLVLSRDRGGQEDPGLYLQPIDGGSLRAIQHTPKSRASYSFTTRDSKTIYYTANDIKPDSYAIYKYDIAAGKRDLVFSDPGLWFIADHRESDNGELQLLLHKATGALSAEYFEWRSGTRALTPLFGQGETTEYRAQYAAQAGQLLVLTNKLGEFRRLYRWNATAGLTPVTPEMKADVSGCSSDRAKKRIYCTVNDGGYTRLRVLDAQTLQPLEIPVRKDADHVYPGAASDDGRFVTLGVETAKAPRTNYVFDWHSKTLTQWVLPSAPEVDLSQFAVAQLENYTARDGTTIPMFVRYPAACAPSAPAPPEPCPVIVEFHGGPEGQAQPGFSPYAQLFVDAGFIFVQPNVRGSDGYGKTWLHADNGPKRLDIITDIDDAGKALRTRWTRNGSVPKIGVFGGSYGGYSTLIGMTMFAGTYDAGVSIVGTSNLRTFLLNTAPYRRALRASEYGDPEKDADALEKLSPTNYVDRVRSPLLMIQGVDDPRVPAGESLQMHEVLKARGKPSSLILLEGEGHGAARRGGQVTMIGHALRFFEEHLKGKKTPRTN
jgi:dipeptidyl aminopeptidase/acylaminoacyl peptidase